MILVLAAILPALAAGDANTNGAVKLDPPKVQYRPNEASATTSPWIDANGWKILRALDKQYFYDVPAGGAALAAAEAYVYGAHATIHTDTSGAGNFNSMVEFLKTIPEAALPRMANIGIIDDGSSQTGELMNLLTRHNLLYKIVAAPDASLNMTVRIGSKEYPTSEAADPSFLSHKIRGQLGDEKRLIRVYGSEVVIARLIGNKEHARVHLINYASRPALGVRVRVLGSYTHQTLMQYGKPDMKLQDAGVESGGTEFTVPEITTYAVVDLTK